MTTINHCPTSDIPATAVGYVIEAMQKRIADAESLLARQLAQRQSGQPLWIEYQHTAAGVVEIPRYFLVADWRYVCPYAVMKDAKQRIEELRR